MEPVVQGFDKSYPGIRQLQRAINHQARARLAESGQAYVVTPMGRPMYADDNKEYTLTNYLIQSHAAEILKRKMVEIDAELPGQMILPVHDELVFDFPGDEAVEMARLATEIMNRSEGYRVPITWSGDLLTEDWGEKYREAA
jgi:DNA polymerase-1